MCLVSSAWQWCAVFDCYAVLAWYHWGRQWGMRHDLQLAGIALLWLAGLMMTSSNGNIFRVTGPLCGEFTGPGELPTQRPVTRSFDVFFDLHLNKRLSKQPWGWWFETPSWSFWRQCNARYTYRLGMPLRHGLLAHKAGGNFHILKPLTVHLQRHNDRQMLVGGAVEGDYKRVYNNTDNVLVSILAGCWNICLPNNNTSHYFWINTMNPSSTVWRVELSTPNLFLA